MHITIPHLKVNYHSKPLHPQKGRKLLQELKTNNFVMKKSLTQFYLSNQTYFRDEIKKME